MTTEITPAGDVIITINGMKIKCRVEEIKTGNDTDGEKIVSVKEALRLMNDDGKLGPFALATQDKYFRAEDLYGLTYNGTTGLQVALWYKAWLEEMCLADADALFAKIMPPADA